MWNDGYDSINFEKDPTQEYLLGLKDSFTSFATNQEELYDFTMWIELKGNIGYADEVIKQFKDIHILINKCGHRF